MMQKVRAVFLDRDGVINVKMPEDDYVKNWNEFRFLPGVIESIKRLKQNNFYVILITNQRCIARNIITLDRLNDIHTKMFSEIKKLGGSIDGIYICPHDIKDNCNCRKPKQGMILNAIADFEKQGVSIDIENSFMIGDSEKDIKAGKSVGLKTIAIGNYMELADIIKTSLFESIEFILKG